MEKYSNYKQVLGYYFNIAPLRFISRVVIILSVSIFMCLTTTEVSVDLGRVQSKRGFDIPFFGGVKVASYFMRELTDPVVCTAKRDPCHVYLTMP